MTQTITKIYSKVISGAMRQQQNNNKELIRPYAENSIKTLHNFCAKNNYHISVITPKFVLIHKSYEDWI